MPYVLSYITVVASGRDTVSAPAFATYVTVYVFATPVAVIVTAAFGMLAITAVATVLFSVSVTVPSSAYPANTAVVRL